MSSQTLRRIVLACFLALIALGLAWEIWLAPLRPGAWLLSLKVLPLALAIPPIARGTVRTYQWWSMGILLYLCEGLVRVSSDTGPSVPLAALETALAGIAFAAILAYVRSKRRSAPT
ncbi:MAG: DUF2069 domain-containing protein [Burkholderiaceae bacterium]